MCSLENLEKVRLRRDVGRKGLKFSFLQTVRVIFRNWLICLVVSVQFWPHSLCSILFKVCIMKKKNNNSNNKNVDLDIMKNNNNNSEMIKMKMTIMQTRIQVYQIERRVLTLFWYESSMLRLLILWPVTTNQRWIYNKQSMNVKYNKEKWMENLNLSTVIIDRFYILQIISLSWKVSESFRVVFNWV